MRCSGRLLIAGGNAVPALVELDVAAACARCARGRGCGAALFAPAGTAPRLRCTLAGPLREGARVEVDVPDEAGWLRPVLLAYGLPTLGLLAGTIAPEPWTPLGALAGLGGGLLAWRLASARLEAAGPARPCTFVARATPIANPTANPIANPIARTDVSTSTTASAPAPRRA